MRFVNYRIGGTREQRYYVSISDQLGLLLLDSLTAEYKILYRFQHEYNYNLKQKSENCYHEVSAYKSEDFSLNHKKYVEQESLNTNQILKNHFIDMLRFIHINYDPQSLHDDARNTLIDIFTQINSKIITKDNQFTDEEIKILPILEQPKVKLLFNDLLAKFNTIRYQLIEDGTIKDSDININQYVIDQMNESVINFV